MSGPKKGKNKLTEEDLWPEYEDIIEERILKEWKAKGVKSRDWVKYKVVYFNEENKPLAIPIDKYREMLKEKQKQADADTIANQQPKNKKQTDKKFKKVVEHIEGVLAKFDDKEN